jgi:transposase
VPPIADRPVVLCWHKRIWQCVHPLCGKRTWTETHPAIAPRAVLTERARAWAFAQVGDHDAAVDRVARRLGVGWHTVMRIVVEQGTPIVEDPARLVGVSAVGVDETAFLAATGQHPTLFATGVTDLSPGRSARLLDVLQGRSGPVLARWLGNRDPAWKARVGTASLDPFRGYATALHQQLPDATRVLDPFHVVRLALTALDRTRRRVQQEQTGHRGRTGDPLYAIRRLLRRRADHHSPHSWRRLTAGLTSADPDGEITAAWLTAQDLMTCYRTRDAATGQRLISTALDCPVPDLARLGRTLATWRGEFLAAFDHTEVSNGPTENLNLKIKNTKRVARGYRNFTNYRLRLLLNHGRIRDDHLTSRIRTRRPSLAA